MKSFPILLALCVLLLGSLHTHAQTNTEHVYEDSSILYPPEESKEIIAAPVEDEQATAGETVTTGDTETYTTDTSLVKNKNILSADSILLLKNSKQFAYAKVLDSLLKDLRKKQEKKVNETVEESPSGPSWIERFFSSKITEFFMWGLAIAFIGFIVVKLFLAGGYFQRGTARTNIKVMEEENTTPAKDKNFDNMIAMAKTEQNYRLATRYLYLQLLQKLTAAGAIEFAADKTNSEYLRELTGKPYKQEIAQLTLNYEYVWYGEFAIDSAAFSKLESRFKNVTV